MNIVIFVLLYGAAMTFLLVALVAIFKRLQWEPDKQLPSGVLRGCEGILRAWGCVLKGYAWFGLIAKDVS